MSSQVKAMKSGLRSDLLQQIRNASSVQKKEWSTRIQQNLNNLLSTQQGYWGAYRPLSDEPEIDWSQVSSQINWCFPQTLEKNLQFKFAARSHVKSALGVQEPIDGVDVGLDQLQGVVVPGVAFGKNGYRLGRGKGFYDRALSTFSGKKVGVCFGLSLKPETPHEDHDVLFHQIVTENSVYQVDFPEGDIKWN